MKNALISIYAYFYSKNNLNKYKKNDRVKWLVFNIGFRVCEIVFYYFIKVRYYFSRPFNFCDLDSEITVSLTSFPERINDLWMTIDSLMCQSYSPRRVVLYLSRQQFPNGIECLPKKLRRYSAYGLEIQFKEGDLKPHKKYYYAMQDYPDTLLVTVDDDLYYRTDMLKNLIEMHRKYSRAVCANTVRKIAFDDLGNIMPYCNWEREYENVDRPSNKLVAIGSGGILYPVKYFTDKRMFDVELIKEKALFADDLWLKGFELVNDIPVVSGGYYHPFIEIYGSQKMSLKSINVNRKKANNDSVWISMDSLLNINNIAKKEIL